MTEEKRPVAPAEYSMTICAPSSDVDGLGHISNIAYVRWIQDVAVAHSAALGYDAAAYLQRSQVFVVRKHEVTYLLPSYAGDALTLRTHVASFRGAQCERHTRIVRDSDGADVTRAVTQWAYISTITGRPTRIPKDMQAAFFRRLEEVPKWAAQ